jgi:eukaryotic-like serine/threonine-protein kinase
MKSRNAETITVGPEQLDSPPPAGRAKPQIIAGSGPHLTSETRPLLRFRLRAAALILLVSFVVFLVRHVVGILTGEPVGHFLLGVHVSVVLVLCCVLVLLYRDVPLSMPQLRFAELVIFVPPAVFFVLLQHRWTLIDVDRGFVTPPMAFWLLLIFTYAMFIPNTWKRASLVIGAMALAPVLLVFGMALVYPKVAAVITTVDVLQHLFVMLVTALGAVFGAHLINALRREAFEAKQLGQYRLISPLGSGGMGEVFLAEHCMLKRPCAIKLIRPERAGDSRVLARFEQEVRLTARLSHWNTIEIFDYGRTEDGTFFYVMEYLPGLSFEELLQQFGPLPAARVIHALRQCCQGLHEAHSTGLIHRDIKPGNLFAAQRGGIFDVVKVLDFGLVKQITGLPSARLTQDGAISGTPSFMSPEQANGLGDVDARSDIYSLGAVAYALLTGHPPFERRTPLEVLIAHARDEVVPPSQLWANVPADLEAIVLRCLAKDPNDRYQDTEALDEALANCECADLWTKARARAWWQENGEPVLTQA